MTFPLGPKSSSRRRATTVPGGVLGEWTGESAGAPRGQPRPPAVWRCWLDRRHLAPSPGCMPPTDPGGAGKAAPRTSPFLGALESGVAALLACCCLLSSGFPHAAFSQVPSLNSVTPSPLVPSLAPLCALKCRCITLCVHQSAPSAPRSGSMSAGRWVARFSGSRASPKPFRLCAVVHPQPRVQAKVLAGAQAVA